MLEVRVPVRAAEDGDVSIRMGRIALKNGNIPVDGLVIGTACQRVALQEEPRSVVFGRSDSSGYLGFTASSLDSSSHVQGALTFRAREDGARDLGAHLYRNITMENADTS